MTAKPTKTKTSAKAKPKAKTKAAPAQKLYRPIREVSALLGVKPHVLRYWETQFPSLRPKKNRAGNRIYRPDEIELLTRIQDLLHARCLTVEGARRRLAEEKRPTPGGARRVVAGEPAPPVGRTVIKREATGGAAGKAGVVESEAAAASSHAALEAAAAREAALTASIAELRDQLLSLARELRNGSEGGAPDAAAPPLPAKAVAI